MRDCFQQLHQFGIAIVRHSTLLCKVVVVGWDEFADRDDTGWLALEQIYHFSTELNELGITYRALGTQKPRIYKQKKSYYCTSHKYSTNTALYLWIEATA